MAAVVTANINITISDGVGGTNELTPQNNLQWGVNIAQGNGSRQTINLGGSAFTNLNPPATAQLAWILLATTATGVYLKAQTGDSVGVLLNAALNMPVIIPLGASADLGLDNTGAATQCQVGFY